MELVIVLLFILARALQSNQKEKEETGKALNEVWSMIRPSLSEQRIRQIVGVPQQIIPVDPEVWIYQVRDLKGFILFQDGFVVGYKKPE